MVEFRHPVRLAEANPLYQLRPSGVYLGCFWRKPSFVYAGLRRFGWRFLPGRASARRASTLLCTARRGSAAGRS